MAADASDYPVSADSIPRTNPADNLTGHSNLHDKVADAIEEIQGFVGVQGDTTAGTLVKRISDNETDIAALQGTDIDITLTGSVTGTGTISNLGDVSIDTTTNHNHDSSYYTESEVNSLLGGKADSSHSHSYLPTSGGTLSGNLVFSGNQYILFEGSTADGNETKLNVINPTLDRTISLPNASGTVSLDGHTHSYAATSHTHSYAATNHTHSYAATSHSHDYSASNHGHTNMFTGKRGRTSVGGSSSGAAITWDAAGYFYIPHGLGSAPIFAAVHPEGSATSSSGDVILTCVVSAIYGTNFLCRIYEIDVSGFSNNSSGTVSSVYGNSTKVDIAWMALA